jgi:D-glycero-D-manno-heptose 1,7-bisphosphate phosphatase
LADTPAVFLDRDGVINRRRLDHVKSWEEFEFLPGVLPALAQLRDMATTVVVITNQSAVGRGLLTSLELRVIHHQMLAAIREAGGHVTAVYACLHAPGDGCACRKPKPLLFRRASGDLGIALADSIMVGDSATDAEAARAAGCRPVLIGEAQAAPDDGVLHAADLAGAVALWRELAPTVALSC